MIVGYKPNFAIESSISTAYERLSFLALGFFVIYLGGRCFGVRSDDASLLACSYGEVKDRITNRGKHTAPFATEVNPSKIANAFRDAIYAPNQEDKMFFSLLQPQFSNLFYSNKLVWAPDGDEAFDDSSYVLQFDVRSHVRLIAFKLNKSGQDNHHDPATLIDVWLEANEFYGILERWRDAFEAEWQVAPKISERDDGAEKPNEN